MGKIVPFNKISKFSEKLKSLNERIVLIGGCFDILHLGHVRFIKNAKKLGDILVIFLESDEKIKQMKGKNRLINSQSVRAEILNSLEDVNYIILLPPKMEDKDYDLLVKFVKPDFIATTKDDPKIGFKKRSAKIVGAKVKNVINRLQNYSTEKIINKNS